MNDKEALVALSSFVAFGPVRLKLILEFFGSASKAWSAGRLTLESTGLSPNLVENFITYRDKFNPAAYFNQIKEGNINIVSIFDDEYPGKLLALADKPILLYVKGQVNVLDKPSIAVIGTRQMSLYGRNTTSLFTDELVKGGYAIVSGLARGVDTRAHEATLREGGETVAILGSGIDRVYPSENYSLSERIVAGGGVVISEYPLGYPPLPSNFILRNRLISGLSDAVVVIEGKRKSGTLITATHAANQGRMVFAVPGQIDSPLSEASHFLIQNGAKLVTTPKDILEEVNETSLYDAGAIKQEMEQKLIQIVNEQPLHIDDIAKMSSLDTLDVSARLTNMEIKGLIKGLGKGYYQKIES